QYPAFPSSSERCPWRVPPAPDGVICSQPLLHEVVVEESDNRETLLHRGVREAATGVDSADLRRARIWALSELANVSSNMSATCALRADAGMVTETKVIFQPTSVRIDRVGRPAQISMDLQPGTCPFVCSDDRITAPLDLSHTRTSRARLRVQIPRNTKRKPA